MNNDHQPDLPFIKDGNYAQHHAQLEFVACLEKGIKFAAHGDQWFYNINNDGWIFSTNRKTVSRQQGKVIPNGM